MARERRVSRMIIDAKSLKTKIMIHNMCRARGYGKTYTRLAMLEAYLESLHTGKPVELEIGFVKVPIK